LLNDFFKNEKIIQYIEEKAKLHRALLIKYFCQVGLANENSTNAIVDLRGTRTSHEIINNLIIDAGFNAIQGFYFEVVEDRKPIKTAGLYYSDFFRERMNLNTNLYGVSIQYNLFEQFYSLTDQNRTIGYELRNNYVFPFFDDENDGNCINRNSIAKIHNLIIEKFVELFIETKLYLFVDSLYFSIIIPTISQFGLKPRREYLKAIENFYESDNLYSKKLYIKKFDAYDWLNILTFSKKIKKRVVWYEGTLSYNMNENVVVIYHLFFSLVRKIRNKFHLW